MAGEYAPNHFTRADTVMAQQYTVQYIDDIDGTELGSEASTIAFSFDGRDYSIDLSEENAQAFREAIAPYIEAATRLGGTRRKSTKRGGGAKAAAVDTKAVREWARESGYEVSDRGRIPAAVLAAYAEAH